MIDFEASGFYPSAMWDENSVYPRRESVFAFKTDMNDVYVKSFLDRTLNRNCDGTAILKLKYYKPPNLIIQH